MNREKILLFLNDWYNSTARITFLMVVIVLGASLVTQQNKVRLSIDQIIVVPIAGLICAMLVERE